MKEKEKVEINYAEAIVKRIDDLCKKKNRIKNQKITSYRIAKDGNLDTGTLNNVLNGTRKDPRYSTITKVCKGLGISLRDFFDDDLFN